VGSNPTLSAVNQNQSISSGFVVAARECGIRKPEQWFPAP
jgi:hypothetical protein